MAKKQSVGGMVGEIDIPALVQASAAARVQEFLESDFAEQMQEIVEREAREQIQAALAKRIAAEVPPYLDALVFTPTNGYGEPKGTPETLKEHIHRVVRTWLEEPVSFQGKTKAEDNYSFRGVSTRGAYLVGQNIQYAMEHGDQGAARGRAEGARQVAGGCLPVEVERAVGRLHGEGGREAVRPKKDVAFALLAASIAAGLEVSV